MDITEDENLFKLEELTSYTEYLNARAKFLDAEILQEYQHKKKENAEKKISDGEVSAKAKGNRVSNEIKARAVHLVDVHPKNSARAVALELKLEPRTVQRWYKAWKEDPDSLFKAIGRPRVIEPEGELAEATKQVVSDFYFKQPTSTMDQLMEQLNTSFGNLAISKRTLYRYMADLWLFSLKRIRLEPEDRNSPEKIQQRKEWVQLMQIIMNLVQHQQIPIQIRQLLLLLVQVTTITRILKRLNQKLKNKSKENYRRLRYYRKS